MILLGGRFLDKVGRQVLDIVNTAPNFHSYISSIITFEILIFLIFKPNTVSASNVRLWNSGPKLYKKLNFYLHVYAKCESDDFLYCCIEMSYIPASSERFDDGDYGTGNWEEANSPFTSILLLRITSLHLFPAFSEGRVHT